MAKVRFSSAFQRSFSFLGVLCALTSPGFAAGPAAKGAVKSAQAQVWLTTYDREHLLAPQPALPSKAGASSDVTVTVDVTKTFQQLDGFGASLTESSAWLINHKLSPAAREELLQHLFNPKSGAGLNFLRQPMGASDFALSSYTYDDLPPGQTDPELQHFSIERDRGDIIPLLKRIREINPDLKIMATPWSPPGWMKTSDSIVGGKIKPEAYDWLAAYFLKFIQAYAAEGLPIYAVSLQNEPAYEPPGYPGMLMSARDQAEVIKRLGPALRAAGLKTKILVWDHNWDHPEYPLEVLSDPQARQFVAGTAWHCYAGNVDAQTKVKNAHPELDVYFTECSGSEGQSSFRAALQWAAGSLIDPVRHWARSVVLWNLALDKASGPINGGCTTCRGVVTVDQASGEVTYNADYYALGHASKFLRPGARRASSETAGSSTVRSAAFLNPDGGRVLIVTNASLTDETVSVKEAGRSFTYDLPGNAVVTLVWK